MKQASKLCIIISGPSFEMALCQVKQANDLADILEFRLDLFLFSELEQLTKLRHTSHRPVIFTVRRGTDGGQYFENEEKRFQVIKDSLFLKPDYLDLEWDIPQSFFSEVIDLSPKLQIICSRHELNETTHDLETMLQEMRTPFAGLYKMVTFAGTCLDALRLLEFVKLKNEKGESLAGMCIGIAGEMTRILGAVYGSRITYAPLDDANSVASGQLSANTLLHTYHYRKLNSETRVYGLIGHPVEHSPSHYTHNAVFRKLGLDAVYVKIDVNEDELFECLALMQKLNFYGLSVTMPLKEKIMAFCLSEDPSIKAINTLRFEKCGLFGFNTDGEGALEAIQHKMNVNEKTVVLLGAGGVAKAIAHKLYQQNVKLVILNRCDSKARQLVAHYNGIGDHLDNFAYFAKQGYDLLINCTSVGMESNQGCPIDYRYLIPSAVVMETITYPHETRLVYEAKLRGCSIISGYELFQYQAAQQFMLWFNIKSNSASQHLLPYIEHFKNTKGQMVY